MKAEETISHLNRLIEACRNGELGYNEAARLVEEPRLQSIFESYAKERSGFAKELAAEVERLGGKPVDSGTFGGALHRGWIDLKATATLGEGRAILSACETGEDAAFIRYAHASDSGITGESRERVEKQWAKIKEAIAHLGRLKREIEAEEAGEEPS
ncbi:MAG TPA: PA2169 family four-helix-bundle protein [Bryobacteraceae bacterium]|nr:PA2169 family four-helix-bundle protein [Bryobacteraceae bacterium]